MGGFCPVTRRRSLGRFREPPPPALPGRGRGARKKAGIFPGGRLPGPGKPQAWVQSAVVGGPRSWVQGTAPEPPSSGWHPSPAAPTLSDLTRLGVCCCLRVLAAAVPLTPARKGGARLPVSPPGAKPGSGRLPGLVLPGRLLRPPGASAALAQGPSPAAGMGMRAAGAPSLGVGSTENSRETSPRGGMDRPDTSLIHL